MLVLSLPGFLQAELLGPDTRARTLTAESEDSRKAKELLAARCQNVSAVYRGVKKTCQDTVASHLVSTAAVAFCAPLDDNSLDYCLKSIRGRDFSPALLQVCGQVSSRGYYYSDPSLCLEYFTNNKSSYDSSLVAYCFSQNSSNFRSSLACLNTVRDRQGSAEKLKSECKGKPHDGAAGGTETLDLCIDRVMRQEPLAEPLNCGGRAQNRTGAPPSTSTQR